MVILRNATVIALDHKTPFLGSDGQAPYTYAVKAGGAGGTISSTGLYTAPSQSGRDTIVVTDDLGETLEAVISVLHPLQLVADVISKEMGLANDQVYIYNNKYTIPKDSRLYIAIGINWDKPFANNTSTRPNGQSVEQSVNVQSNLSIMIMSKDQSALNRKEEVIMALNSIYALSQMAANSFYIAKVSTNFVNLTDEEGAAILYKYNISVNVQYFIKKVKSVRYYDDFPTPEIITNE